MTEGSGISERWSTGTLADYLDLDAGVPVVPAEALSTMNSEDHAAAVGALTQRVADLVAVMDDSLVLEVAALAVDDLYRAGTTLAMWTPDVAAYVRATWATIFSSVRGRGYRIFYVVDHEYPERIGRPIELYPDLFTAAGITYICPHVLANQLPEALEAEVDAEGLAPFVERGRELAFTQVEKVLESRDHLAYVEIAGADDTLTRVVALAGASATVGVVRLGTPSPENPPAIEIVARV